ncbi:MAG: hypothetical protein DMF60_04315 [Acidobacteria bacterium]|nr:MAG: hypothetical protein DMF60_04315 [Acidobacteriota bacterium]
MSFPVFPEGGIWCPLCKAPSRFIKVQTAATLVDVSRRTIYRYIEEGKIHAFRVAGASYRVCRSCLVQQDTDK